LLTISSSKGGSCKSTTTRNLAVAAVHGGLLVATVDLDAQQTLTIWNNRRPEAAPTISHYSFALKMANDQIKALINLTKSPYLQRFSVTSTLLCVVSGSGIGWRCVCARDAG
jgi:cellulose biosynthesis protein BcsQ